MIAIDELTEVETPELTLTKRPSEIIREFPQERWGRASLRDSEGRMCALGILYDHYNGDWSGSLDIDSASSLERHTAYILRVRDTLKEVLGPHYRTQHHITSINDTKGKGAVVDFLESRGL